MVGTAAGVPNVVQQRGGFNHLGIRLNRRRDADSAVPDTERGGRIGSGRFTGEPATDLLLKSASPRLRA